MIKHDIEIGDTVRISDTASNRLSPRLKARVNKTYAVLDVRGSLVALDGDFRGELPVNAKRIEKVTRSNGFQSKDYIIALKEGGKYKPAETPRTYSSLEQAKGVAREMAEKHRGRFVVFAVVAYVELPKLPTPIVVELN